MTTAVESLPMVGWRRRSLPIPPEFAVPPWIDDAACRGRGDLFFAPAGERPGRRNEREAQARVLCAACPVLDPCCRFARDQREYGFWGGESEEERVAAGYPVAMPVGRVAKTIQALRQAGRLPSGPRRVQPPHAGGAP